MKSTASNRENEDDDDDEKEKDEENEEESETIVQAWETSGALAIELHDCDDHREVLAIEQVGEDDEEGEESTVALAFSVEELDEVLKILGEARAAMVKRTKN